MFRPRIIPVLLLRRLGLVKSVNFKNHQYIGDPINAVRIYNELKADELVFLDIDATNENRLISLDFVRDVGEEANMPFAVGGGIKSIEDIRKVTNAGAEKVVINSAAALDPNFIKNAAEEFGSSTIVVCIDVKKKFLGGIRTWTKSGKISTKHNPIEFAQLMQDCGAGEIIIQSIEQDGKMEGYDINLIQSISKAVTIPVVALGGAGNSMHLKEASTEGFANGLAAGSMFVYQGKQKGVLINYLTEKEKREIFAS
jgi:cyclase